MLLSFHIKKFITAHRKEQVEEISPIETYGDQPIIDTGAFDGWENPFSSNPFGGLFGSLDGKFY